MTHDTEMMPQLGTILLVDDEELARRTMRRILLRSFPCFEVRAAQDGDQALDMLDDDIVCIISDIQMPCTNGFRLCWSVRNSAACRPWRDLPIVLVSGQQYNEQAMDEAWRVGTAHLVRKPFQPAEIEQTVASALSIRIAPAPDLQPTRRPFPLLPPVGGRS